MERHYAFLFAAFALGIGLHAQTSDVVVFSDEGDKFTLVIDGDVKNEVPAARVVAKGIRNETPLLIINFQDKQIPTLKQNSWMEPGQEYTLRITTNKKGAKVLRMQGQAPLGTASAEPASKPAPGQFTEDAAAPASTREVIATDGPTTKSTTTITTTEGVPDGNVNMSIGVNGVGLNVAVTDGMGGTSTTTTTTTTTTYTSTTTGTAAPAPAPVEEDPVVAGGCRQAMSATDFEDARKSIDSKGFDETKLTLAKQIAGSNCLSTSQVKSIMELFGFEDSKLDFAKFAYDHVMDRNNYYKVNDAFGFSSSVDELNSYIQSR
ncbi:MAG: DUF4476 domain-containing protein [Flavobacteriales bacterium]|jgi:hypothetical protein|nr:DUF4476 domain-containing protein [Flavobacteriales bacterium]